MTPEQRATVIGLAFIAAVQKELMKPGASDLEFKVAIESALEQLRSDIAAAVKPSEAVKLMVERFFLAIQDAHVGCEEGAGGTIRLSHCADCKTDFDALAAVRLELGL